jgi:hypothetical protein
MKSIPIISSCIVVVSAALVLTVFATGANAENSGKSANKIQQVKIRLEARGDIYSTEADTEDANPMPIIVNANFRYEELIQQTKAAKAKSKLRSVRFYEIAKADISIGTRKETSILESDNRYVLFNRSLNKEAVDRITMASLGGRLSQRQWQLIDVPANTMLIDALIKESDSLKLRQTWEPDAEVLADILLLDSVEKHSVELKVEDITDAIATISIDGAVLGNDEDVKSNMGIKGSITYDTRAKACTKIQLSMRQKRNEGQVGPGFDGLVKIVTEIQPQNTPNKLTKANIANARGNRAITSDLVLNTPNQALQLIHDRRWRPIMNTDELAVLRMLADKQVMCQFNIMPMPRLPAQDAYTLEDFKASVSKAIGKAGEVTDANSRKLANGNIIYFVEASGLSSEVELTWLYYNVTQPNGNRAMCILTSESDLVDSIRDAEKRIVESIQIRSPEQANAIRKAQNGDSASKSR